MPTVPMEVEVRRRLSRVPWRAFLPHRDLVVQALREVLDGAVAAKVLARTLKRLVPSTAESRQAVAEGVFGVALWRRALAHSVGLDVERPGPEHAERLLYAFLCGLAGVEESVAQALCGLPAILLPVLRPPSVRPEVRTSLPDWLWDVLRDGRTDAEAECLAASLNFPGPVFLRVNRGRIHREALAQRLREEEGFDTVPTQLSPLGLELRTPQPNILGSRAHQEGLFEVQDEGSQLLGLALDVHPGHTVFDACAGAGGKTLLLAAELGSGGGELHAFDPDAQRLVRLERRASIAQTRPLFVHRSWPPVHLLYDRVLVDAPCSELGALRRGPDVRWRLAPSDFAHLPALQRDILDQAARHVRPGGKLLYATCTLARSENADVVYRFLQTHPEFRLVPPFPPALRASLPAQVFTGLFFTPLPHLHRTDAFFAALLERLSEGPSVPS